MPGPNFRLSPVDGELLARTLSTQATPMFTLTGSASRPEISAFDRACPLEKHSHRKCPPGRITPLEYALTENRACKSFRIRTYIFIGLKAPWNEHLQKKGGGGCLSLTREPTSLVPRMSIAALPGFISSAPLDRADANRCSIAANSPPNGSTARRCHARIFD
jgi:hypothetical protein